MVVYQGCSTVRTTEGVDGERSTATPRHGARGVRDEVYADVAVGHSVKSVSTTV